MKIKYTINSIGYVGNTDTNGNITGTYITIGTINYETGALNVTFSQPLDAGTELTADYNEKGYFSQNINWDITIDNISIKGITKSIKLTQDENQIINDIDIEIAGLSNFETYNPLTNRGTERIVLTIGDKIFKFLIETRTKSETFNDPSFTLWGRQKTALLGEEYSDKVAVIYENKYASVIAQELAGDITVNWTCGDYWVAEASFDDLKIDAIRDLAEAIGGIVRTTSDSDGSSILTVRPLFSYRPSDIANVVSDIALGRNLILSLACTEEQAKYNSVTVFLQKNINEAQYQISTEETCYKKGRAATIKVYSSKPSEIYDICVTDGERLKLSTSEEEILTETINISGGTGSTERPIFEIISYSLQNCSGDDVVMTYSAGLTEVVLSGVEYAILQIVYKTKYDKWEIKCFKDTELTAGIIVPKGEHGGIEAVMGNANKKADDIKNPLIFTDSQAIVVGKAFLDSNFYRKKIYSLEIPYQALADGMIAALEDDVNNVYGKGIIRVANISIDLSGDAVKINQELEVYIYENDGTL